MRYAFIRDQQFGVAEPNQIWVTDITYIRTYESWRYLAVVLDLFSRQVISWSMQSRIDRELLLAAPLMAVWRRQPRQEVIVHSDQGSQYGSDDWQAFRKAHGLVASMGRRGDCHDNAVAESFFQLLKRERIRCRIYPDRAAARQDVFEYMEMFSDPVWRHGHADRLSPVEFERRHTNRLGCVWRSRGDSLVQDELSLSGLAQRVNGAFVADPHLSAPAEQIDAVDHAGGRCQGLGGRGRLAVCGPTDLNWLGRWHDCWRDSGRERARGLA